MKGLPFRLSLRANAPPLAWGRPDSPRRLLCGICHRRLSKVPLLVWRDDGARLGICDPCVDTWIEVKPLEGSAP